MTFTEAAVEVLRLVGRPLHYKKITEIAVAKNLLSHVGKAPDMTMSSRLATMIKKDRGDEPIIKVKPGVFGLREFTAEVLALADADADIDIAALPDVEIEPEEEDAEALAEAETEKRPRPPLPGADVFPEEEDDDEPILARVDEPAREDKSGAQKDGGRRRRRRRGRKGGDEGPAEESPRSRRQEPRAKRGREVERLDMSRAPDEGEVLGQDLADAAFAVLEAQRPEPLGYAKVAELLIRKGRLAGAPAALAPTLAAAVRADGLRRGAEGPRFRFVDGRLALTEWYLPNEAAKLDRDARRACSSQRDVVHRAFLRKLGDLPTAAFAELMATWLNAEGVSALRAVRRPGSSGVELHLAGTLKRGHEDVRVAILVLRDGRDLRAERVVEVRGALHHYGQASTAWVITTGRADSGAQREVAVPGAPPIVLFDGRALAGAMEARSVGLRSVALPLATIDLDLLDTLRGEPEDLLERGRGRDREEREEEGGRQKRRRRGRQEREDEEVEESGEAATEEGSPEEPEGASEESADEGAEENAEEAPRRRRRRRRGRKRAEEGAEAQEDATESDAEAGEADEAQAEVEAAPEESEPEDAEPAGFDEDQDEDVRLEYDEDDSDSDEDSDSDSDDDEDSDEDDSDSDDEDEGEDDSDSDDDEESDEDVASNEDDEDEDADPARDEPAAQ